MSNLTDPMKEQQQAEQLVAPSSAWQTSHERPWAGVRQRCGSGSRSLSLAQRSGRKCSASSTRGGADGGHGMRMNIGQVVAEHDVYLEPNYRDAPTPGLAPCHKRWD